MTPEQYRSAAQAGQEPCAWIDRSGHPKHISYLQSPTERKLYGQLMPLYATTPAPTNSLAIAEAALNAALNACSIAAENNDHPFDCINGIRAIKPQTIIDAARGK